MTADSSNVPASRRWAASILQICRFASVLVVALGMLALDFAGAQEREKVVAYVAVSERMIIPALAQQTGIFHKHGLDARIIGSAPFSHAKIHGRDAHRN